MAEKEGWRYVIWKGVKLKLTFEVDIGVIEEENFNRAPIVGVDDASAGIDEVLGCKPTARGYTSICAVVIENMSVCK